MNTALSATGVDTLQFERSTCCKITQQKRVMNTYYRQGQEVLKVRFDVVSLAARPLCERQTSRAHRLRLLGNFTDDTNALTVLSRVKISVTTTLYQPTVCCFQETAQHSFHPYPNHADFTAVQHVQITRRRNFVCHPDVGLLLSLVRIVVCWDCHVTSYARST